MCSVKFFLVHNVKGEEYLERCVKRIFLAGGDVKVSISRKKMALPFPSTERLSTFASLSTSTLIALFLCVHVLLSAIWTVNCCRSDTFAATGFCSREVLPCCGIDRLLEATDAVLGLRLLARSRKQRWQKYHLRRCSLVFRVSFEFTLKHG